MNGIMFYLDRDVPLVRGHTIYIDSPWALTSISQAQFWKRFKLERMGDGRVEGILSVDVSDWEREGIVHRKQAIYCSKEQVREEVWAQLKTGLNDAGIDGLEDANVLAWFLDPSIVYPNPNEATNLEPLFDQHGGLVGRPAGCRHRGREPVPGIRLRAHPYRPRDHGGGERGGQAAGQRNP
jgi:15-cis-phytoene desaturase